MSRIRVLFVCTANAARSQMAEAVLRHLRPDTYQVFSAGTRPKAIDDRALKALRQMKISTAELYSKELDEFRNQQFDYVIALCSKSHAECQTLDNGRHFMAWDFADPQESSSQDAFIKTLREIQQRIQMFLLVTEKPKTNTPSKALFEPSISPTEFFKSMADDNRARMMLLIQQEGELCVCELTCAMDESQPKVSRHLGVLRKARLLIDRRQGQWVYYRLNPNLPAWIATVLATTGEASREWLAEQHQRLQAMGDRPSRNLLCVMSSSQTCDEDEPNR